MCSPKEEVGLGFKPLRLWNQATMTRHLWALSKKADSLWVRWIHSYIIKGKCLWMMQLPQNSPWTIRKLFKLRDKVQPLIKHVIGDGDSTFLWLDHWHNVGPLYKVFGDNIVRNVGSSPLAKVYSIIHEGEWQWPRQRNRAIMQIMGSTPLTLKPNSLVADSVIWIPTRHGMFSVNSALQAFRTPLSRVLWADIVWFKPRIPRWAFIMWLVCWGRLSTKDRILSWGLVVDPICVLCRGGTESHSHLFFECPFSALVWAKILQKFGICRCPAGWSQEIDWAIHHLKKSGFLSSLYKLAMAGSVCHIWRARNECICCNKQPFLEVVYDRIINDVRDRVYSWKKVGVSHGSKVLCKAWNISVKIL